MRQAKILALLFCLTLLIGCGGDATRPVVSFAIFGEPAELAAYQELVAAFAAAHPEIEIDLRHVPGQSEYRQRLATEFSAGQPPDVMLLNYRRMAPFAVEGGLEPLAPYLRESGVIQPADFYPITLQAFTYEGQLWCIPQNMSSLVVYYNQDLFAAAGLAAPAPDWTWADFLDTARALTRDTDGNGQIDQYGAGIDASLYRLAPFVWQNGGQLVDDAAAPTRLALDELASGMGFVVGKKGRAPDGSRVLLRLTGPVAREIRVAVDGRATVVEDFGGADPTIVVTMDGLQFSRLAGGRPLISDLPQAVDYGGDVEAGRRIVENLSFVI